MPNMRCMTGGHVHAFDPEAEKGLPLLFWKPTDGGNIGKTVSFGKPEPKASPNPLRRRGLLAPPPFGEGPGWGLSPFGGWGPK